MKILGSIPVAVSVIVLATLWTHPAPSEACVGSRPPQPVCGKTLVLSKAVPGTLLLPGGGTFDVSTLVHFNEVDFPAGAGACPAGPFVVDVALTATCSPAGNGGGSVMSPISLGFNEVTVPVTLPAGPPRRCDITGIATVALADGMTLTATGDAVVCLVEESPDLSGEPRLDLALLGDEIVPVHPGDQATQTYRITNNDLTESFTGTLTVDSENTSRLPGMSGPNPPGTGVYSISDPVQGDNFPIAFEEDLFEGCVVLPEDASNPAIPTIDQLIVLGPGEFVDIDVFSRPWGMCADGSCAESRVVLDGDFSDESPAVACAGSVVAADTSVPPAYLWPDSGEVATVEPPEEGDVVTLKGQPLPGQDAEIDLSTLASVLLVNDVPVPTPPIPFSGAVEPERGRTQLQFPVPNIPVNSELDIIFDLLVTSEPVTADATLLEFGALEGVPTGNSSVAPAGRSLHRIADSNFLVESFFDVTYQLHAVAIDNAGSRREVTWTAVDFSPVGGGQRFQLMDGVVGTGAGTELQAIELAMDLRGFTSSIAQGQLGMIFTDGFESGDVSAWSAASPP